MRSLLVRIFVSFWLMIVITITAAAGLGFFYAERARSAIERFEVSDAMVEASEALRDHDRDGLEDWLDSLNGVTKSLVYVVDSRGRDILKRRLPAPVVLALRRYGDGRRRGPGRDNATLRPARPFTELVGSDGDVYTIFVLPPQGNVSWWLASRSVTTLAMLAFLASAVVSYLLARRKAGDLPEFARMDEETERLDALIGQILEFSRLDAKSTEERAQLNLFDLVHAVVDDVRSEFGDDVDVTLEAPGNSLSVNAYENALRACVSNVLRNAAMHGGKGKSVLVSVKRDSNDAVITVRDSGGGVAEEDLEHLFEPFYRATSPGDEGASQGTGLGLAIASRAILKNGGSIQARNRDDGLCVTIRTAAIQ